MSSHWIIHLKFPFYYTKFINRFVLVLVFMLIINIAFRKLVNRATIWFNVFLYRIHSQFIVKALEYDLSLLLLHAMLMFIKLKCILALVWTCISIQLDWWWLMIISAHIYWVLLCEKRINLSHWIYSCIVLLIWCFDT